MLSSNTCLSKCYILALLSLGFLLLSHGSITLAQEETYTNASLTGEYAYIAVGESGRVKVNEGEELAPSGEGSVGVFKFDGSGKGSCGTITTIHIVAGQSIPGDPAQPIPGAASEYSCVEVSYRVRSPNDPADFPGFPQPLSQQNGTGLMTITLELQASEDPSDEATIGTQTTFNTDFVITKAERVFGNVIATEVYFIREDLTGTGNLVTGYLKRRPVSALEYSDASLQGTYAFASLGRYGATPQARTGIVTYDGKGTGSGFAIANFNFPPDPANRVVFRGNVNDAFQMNRDGTGTFYFVIPPAGDRARYAAVVITQAEKIGSQLIAKEIFFVNFDPCCQFIPVAQPGLNFTTTVVTRLPD